MTPNEITPVVDGLDAPALAKTKRRRGPPCRDASHARRPRDGSCRVCQATRVRQRRLDAANATGLVQPGVSMRSVGSRVGWATKRARYGETGVSPDVSARLSQAVTERVRRNGHHNSAKTTCKHGHPLTGDNVYTYRAANGRWYRQCRACHRRLMGARPAWVAVDGCRVSISAHDRFYLREYRRLRAAMIAAHPDKGGTAAQFRKAQSRLAAFEEHEMSWYARAGVAVPQRRRRNHAAVLSQGGR